MKKQTTFLFAIEFTYSPSAREKRFTTPSLDAILPIDGKHVLTPRLALPKTTSSAATSTAGHFPNDFNCTWNGCTYPRRAKELQLVVSVVSLCCLGPVRTNAEIREGKEVARSACVRARGACKKNLARRGGEGGVASQYEGGYEASYMPERITHTPPTRILLVVVVVVVRLIRAKKHPALDRATLSPLPPARGEAESRRVSCGSIPRDTAEISIDPRGKNLGFFSRFGGK